MAPSGGCTVEANGTTLTCACQGCGISYNHETGKYIVLCCGSIFELDMKVKPPDPPKRPKAGPIEVDLAGCTRLETAQLLERHYPTKVRADTSVAALGKRVRFRGRFTLPELTKKLALSEERATRS